MERFVFVDWNDRGLAPLAASRVRHWATKLGIPDINETTSLGIESHHNMGLKSTLRSALSLLDWQSESDRILMQQHVPHIMNPNNISDNDQILCFNLYQVEETRPRVAELEHPALVDRVHLFAKFVTGQQEEIQDPEDQLPDIGDILADRISRRVRRMEALTKIGELIGDNERAQRLFIDQQNPRKLRTIAEYISAAQRIDRLSRLLVRKVARS